MRAPRTRSRSAPRCAIRSTEPNCARPCTRPFEASKPIAAKNAWLFPAPDSPTTPTHSPRPTLSAKSLTAATSPSGVLKVTFRSSSRNTESSTVTGIQCIAKTVAHEVETQEQRHEKNCRHQQHPRRRLHLLRPIVDEAAQARERLLNSEPEETQEALESDHLRNREGCVHGHGPHEVGHDV